MNSQNKKILQVSLFVVVAILVLGIGYASINAINIIFNENATVSGNDIYIFPNKLGVSPAFRIG